MFIIGFIAGITVVVVVNMLLDVGRKNQKLDEFEVVKDRLESLENNIKFDRKANGVNLEKIIKDVIKLKEHMSRISGSKE